MSQSPKSGQLHSNHVCVVIEYIEGFDESQSPKSGQLHSNMKLINLTPHAISLSLNPLSRVNCILIR